MFLIFFNPCLLQAAPPLVIHTSLHTPPTVSSTSTVAPTHTSSQAPRTKTTVVPSSTAPTLHTASDESFFKKEVRSFNSVPSEVPDQLIRIQNELCEIENVQTAFIDQMEVGSMWVCTLFSVCLCNSPWIISLCDKNIGNKHYYYYHHYYHCLFLSWHCAKTSLLGPFYGQSLALIIIIIIIIIKLMKTDLRKFFSV